MSTGNPHELISIPGGSFWMGENDEDKFAGDTERPRHLVTIAPFLLGKAPVTLAAYRLFRPGHEPDLPAEWPAAMISWREAVAYCNSLGKGFRLPSEAEWEYAARARSTSIYPWGETITPRDANYYYTEQGAKVGCGHRTPPGAFPPNGFGLLDMMGNLCEWTQDVWHSTYHGAPHDGSAWETEGNKSGTFPADTPLRVLRGGAWDYLPRLLRVSWRDHLLASSCRDNVGFRIACSP